MQTIYRVKIHGRILESRDLKRLLARAVSEKRNMDQRIRLFSQQMAERRGTTSKRRCTQM